MAGLMVGKLVETILKIPAIIEFLIGAAIYLVLRWFVGEVVSGVAEETVCKSPGIDSWLLCFILTNEIVAFVSVVVVIIGIGMLLRYRFFGGH